MLPPVTVTPPVPEIWLSILIVGVVLFTVNRPLRTMSMDNALVMAVSYIKVPPPEPMVKVVVGAPLIV